MIMEMYGLFPYWYRTEFYPVWVTDQLKALEMIRQSVQGERNDELFYDELIKLAPTKEAGEIIGSIRDDERGHNRMFRGIYKALTGQDISGISNEQYKKVNSYDEGLQQALLGELSAVEKYRSIWFGLPVG